MPDTAPLARGGTGEYLAVRPRLFAIAYRMLSSVKDAEDIVQEAYLRWQAADRSEVRSGANYLTAVTVRLCLDELRSARARRETYVGPWLPEPLVSSGSGPGGPADPAGAAELADSLSMAFLVMLETLSPLERATFLLREVFGYGYDEIGRLLGKEPAACRQLVSRARRHVRQGRRRYDPDRRHGAELVRRFQEACVSGDLDGMLELLAADATVWTDGGGLVKAARRPVTGARKVARFLIAIAPTVPAGATVHDVTVNGQPGVLITHQGKAYTVIAFDILSDRITGVRIVSSPLKLASVRVPAD